MKNNIKKLEKLLDKYWKGKEFIKVSGKKHDK